MAAVAVAIGFVAEHVAVVQRGELIAIDSRFAVRGREPPPRGIVIVGIDAPTFGDLRLRYPFPRSVHAGVIDRLTRDGARQIVYDISFQNPTTPREDAALLAAIRRARSIVLAVTQSAGFRRPVILGGARRIEGWGARLGVAQAAAPERGAYVRRMFYSSEGVETLPVAAAHGMLGHPPPAAGFRHGLAWIDYRGPPGTFPAYSFGDVLRGRLPPSTFRGKAVVVGGTAAVLQDRHPTPPSGQLMSGPEIQANALATVLAGTPLRSAPRWLDVLILIVLGVGAPLCAWRLTGLRALLGTLALLAAFLAAAQLAFDGGTIVRMVSPLLALGIGAAGALMVDYATETRERRRTESVLSRFVPRAVVPEVMAQTGDDLRLGGKEVDATVLFCDLRGFTAFAERRPANVVIDALNCYLTHMSEAVRREGGTVVSYMGDGMMAVFGAPVESPDHADHALSAADRMLSTGLREFNDWLRERGMDDEFEAGIGLSSGPVLSGNVGAHWRLEYAAVGDTTNVAARLEAMTKTVGRALLIAGSTRERLTEPRELSFVGEVMLEGRSEPTPVWAAQQEEPE